MNARRTLSTRTLPPRLRASMASAVWLQAGPGEGIARDRVRATLLVSPPSPDAEAERFADFHLTSLVPGPPADTRIVGTVLDNQDAPIPGVTVRVAGGMATTSTDGNGAFVLSGVPAGTVHLTLFAASSSRPGPWPTMAFEVHTVSGRDNDIGGPIYIPRLDASSSRVVGGDEDVTLRLAGLDGATLLVHAGSVTCPDGGHECALSWTQVNLDRVPMTDPLGGRFLLAGTLQPAGVLFDPPARLCVPNPRLLPGEQIELASFDHDLEDWVGIGTGTVSEDGLTICSDPGFGILKSGWHGPYTGGGPGGTDGDGGDDGCPKEGGSGECSEDCETSPLAQDDLCGSWTLPPEPMTPLHEGQGHLRDALYEEGAVATTRTHADSGDARFVVGLCADGLLSTGFRAVPVEFTLPIDIDYRFNDACDSNLDAVGEACLDCGSIDPSSLDANGDIVPEPPFMCWDGDLSREDTPVDLTNPHRCNAHDVANGMAHVLPREYCIPFDCVRVHELKHVEQIRLFLRGFLISPELTELLDARSFPRGPSRCNSVQAEEEYDAELAELESESWVVLQTYSAIRWDWEATELEARAAGRACGAEMRAAWCSEVMCW